MAEPRIGVGVFVANDLGQIVLGCRRGAHGADTWSLPGGKPDEGESLAQTAVRETHEETGLEVEIVRYLGKTDDPMPAEDMHWVTHFFLTRVVGGYMEDTEPEKFTHVGWVPIWNLPSRVLFIPLRNYIEQYGLDTIWP